MVIRQRPRASRARLWMTVLDRVAYMLFGAAATLIGLAIAIGYGDMTELELYRDDLRILSNVVFVAALLLKGLHTAVVRRSGRTASEPGS
ncbi:hypothetical protein [Nonomuraea recticatena]|uniref:Uncharacterized protein n=1 Tax=Nonomuraea recticatena TaxID=46178 RepID=A0ABP6FSY3_9ACTN